MAVLGIAQQGVFFTVLREAEALAVAGKGIGNASFRQGLAVPVQMQGDIGRPQTVPVVIIYPALGHRNGHFLLGDAVGNAAAVGRAVRYNAFFRILVNRSVIAADRSLRYPIDIGLAFTVEFLHIGEDVDIAVPAQNHACGSSGICGVRHGLRIAAGDLPVQGQSQSRILRIMILSG